MMLVMDNPKTKTEEAPKTYTKLPILMLKEKEIIKKQEKNLDLSNPKLVLKDIHKRRVYKQFLKLIKGKKAISGVLLADILGVSRQTIYKWLDTPLAMSIISDNILYQVSKIQDSKDWKSSAYLIDKLYNKEDKTLIQVNTLEGLTIIRR